MLVFDGTGLAVLGVEISLLSESPNPICVEVDARVSARVDRGTVKIWGENARGKDSRRAETRVSRLSKVIPSNFVYSN